MKNNKRLPLGSHKGFTIIEFLLATTFFTFILIFVLAGFLQISRAYVKGVTTNKVHQAGRNIIETMVSEMKSASDSSISTAKGTGADADKFCATIGNKRYIFVASDQAFPVSDLTTGQIHAFEGGNCSSFDLVGSSGGLVNKEELSVQYFNLVPLAGSTDLYIIYLALSTGNYLNDLISVNIEELEAELENSLQNTSDRLVCDGGAVGGQYCDIVFLRETVSIRN